MVFCILSESSNSEILSIKYACQVTKPYRQLAVERQPPTGTPEVPPSQVGETALVKTHVVSPQMIYTVCTVIHSADLDQFYPNFHLKSGSGSHVPLLLVTFL
jgi:hypothetical protein